MKKGTKYRGMVGKKRETAGKLFCRNFGKLLRSMDQIHICQKLTETHVTVMC